MTLVLDHTAPLGDTQATSGAALAAKPTLAGLSRERLRAALAAAGVPEKQLRMRVIQLWR